MSANGKNINIINEKETNKEKGIKPQFFSFSSKNNLSNDNNTKNINQISFSESINSKIKGVNDKSNKIINFSTNFETFSNGKLDLSNNENENILYEKIQDVYQDSFIISDYKDLYSNNTFKKPTLSLKDSRTKLKQLRDKLYPLTEDEKISIQSEILPVPFEKMNDENYKILKMHYLKKPSIPEYKSCKKYDEYYKSFEDSLNKKNEYFFLKKKKNIYSNSKFMKLEINLKSKNNEKNFPLYKDQDIGVYEYWQIPLIESKIDEDIDSDEEQIKLAQKVCEMDLFEGIKYIENNGIKSLMNNRFTKKEDDNNIKCKSV